MSFAKLRRFSARIVVASIAAAILVRVAASLAADEPPVIPIGSDAYRLWDRWPYQRIGERAYMRSTYDRTGGNESADASHFLYQLADDYSVTLDVEGPGILYFVRTNHWHGSPWHYTVDGVDHLVQETSTGDPLHPAPNSVFLPERLFPSPLAWTWAETKGSDLNWVPVGFQNSLRIAYSRTFYGTGYYIYHQFVGGVKLSRPIESWDGQTPPDSAVAKVIRSAGTDIAPQGGTAGIREVVGQLNLEAQGTVSVWNETLGPSMLRALEFSVPLSQAVAFSNAHLRVTWDDRASPSIDAPISLFYGAGILYNRDNREFLVKSLPMVIRYGEARVYLSCYFPMPFFRSARIELVGTGQAKIPDVQWKVRYEAYKDPPNYVGYFHATYRNHPGYPTPSPEFGKDLVLLDTREAESGGNWSGSFVGTSFIFSHDAELSTLEGDPRFFFDDSQTPQAQGTGTEEWGGGGDYWGGETMTLPFVGHPVGAKSRIDALNADDKIESAYRFLLGDLMPFGKRAVIQLEHGGWNESTQHYETIAYWYGLPASSLVKTDELAVGDKVSERQHQYVSAEASPPYELTSRYEWGPDTLFGFEIYPATTDQGRFTKKASEFSLKIDRANLGVMLRRKLDYTFHNQRAEVYVSDGIRRKPEWKGAGVWYLAGSNTNVFSAGGSSELGATEHRVQTSNRRFRDDEFLIPRPLTQGRSVIRIRIEFTPTSIPLYPGYPLTDEAWSEMRYSAYSFVMPDFSLK